MLIKLSYKCVISFFEQESHQTSTILLAFSTKLSNGYNCMAFNLDQNVFLTAIVCFCLCKTDLVCLAPPFCFWLLQFKHLFSVSKYSIFVQLSSIATIWKFSFTSGLVSCDAMRNMFFQIDCSSRTRGFWIFSVVNISGLIATSQV